MTGQDHSKLLGILFLVQGGLQLLGGGFVALVYGGMGTAMTVNARRDEEATIGIVFIVLAVVVGILILLFAALNLITGFKLYKQKAGGRIWGIISSCLVLLGFPLGTALGIYGLWFFLGEQGKQFYAGNQSGLNAYPPPPNNWQ